MPRPHHHPNSSSSSNASGSNSSKRRRHQEERDNRHNRDHPCCQELANICHQVLQAAPPHPSSSTTTTTTTASSSSSSLPTLPDLIWHYLFETVQADISNSNNSAVASASSSAAKKKRKKKKKNKKQDELSSSTDEVTVVTTLHPEVTTIIQTLPPPPQSSSSNNNHNNNSHTVNESPKTTPVASFASARTAATPSATSSSAAPTTTMTTTTNLFDMMVQDYFLALSPPSPSSSSSTTPTQSQKLESFWRRVVASSSSHASSSTSKSTSNNHKSGGGGGTASACGGGFNINISADATRPLVAQIVCPRCRAHVHSILETDTKLVLFHPQQQQQPQHPNYYPAYYDSRGGEDSFTMSSLSAATCREVEESSYIRMEEGHVDDEISAWRLKHQQQQQRELSFCLTVSDDETEKVWQLRGMGLSGVGVGSGVVAGTTTSSEDGDNDDSKEGTTSGANAAGDWRRVILYDYILGRGIASIELESTATTTTDGSTTTTRQQRQTFDQNLIRGMANAVQSTVLGHDKVFSDCANLLEKQLRTLQEHQPNGNASQTDSTIDMAAFSRLKGVDEEACVVMAHFLRLLLDVTLSLFVAASSAASSGGGARGSNSTSDSSSSSLPAATAAAAWRQRDLQDMRDSVLVLWEFWLQTTHNIVKRISQYEQYLQDLTDRLGQFPMAFFSPVYRQIYRELVNAKLKAVVSLLDKIRQYFDAPLETPGLNPHDHKARMQRKILTYSVFYQHHLGIDYKRPPPVSDLDEAMQHALESIRECVETPIQASWDQVQMEHEKRQERLLRRCERVFANAKTADLIGTEGRVRELLALTDPDSVIGEDRTTTNRYRSNLGEAAMLLVAGWVREQCHQRSHGVESVAVPSMPVNLLQTMVYGNEDFNCHANAKTRAICILVVLFYRWLSELCDTWRAELAEQDLLTSMSSFEVDQGSTNGGVASASPTGGKGKPGSKKKKKKKSDASSVVQAPSVNIDDSVPSTPAQKNDSDDTGMESPPVNSRGAELSALTDVQLDGEIEGKEVVNVKLSPVAVSSVHSELDVAGNDGKSKVPTNGKTVITKLAPTDREKGRKGKGGRHEGSAKSGNSTSVSTNNLKQEEECDPETINSKVDEANSTPSLEQLIALDLRVEIGVDDASGFQSAEDFLVGRLLAVLKETGKGRN